MLILASMLLLLSNFEKLQCNGEEAAKSLPSLNITARNFQINFLNELIDFMETLSQESLNDYLHALKHNPQAVPYAAQIENATNSNRLDQKVVLVKQLLDAQFDPAKNDAKHFNTIRNVIFIKKLRTQMVQMQWEYLRENRWKRIFELCKQFHKHSDSSKSVLMPYVRTSTTRTTESHRVHLSHPDGKAELSGEVVTIDLTQFGRNLYENIKEIGAGIIDDNLRFGRQLLHELIGQQHTEQESENLLQTLPEIDAILAIKDFYLKRQRLYAYFELHPLGFFEQPSTQYGFTHMNETLPTKWSWNNGDAFLALLFSQFEFLEHLHEEWAKMLPQVPRSHYNENAKLLYDVHKRYTDFKSSNFQFHSRDPSDMYDSYMLLVKELHAKTKSLGDDARIYELLLSASESVGIFAMYMITEGCNSL